MLSQVQRIDESIIYYNFSRDSNDINIDFKKGYFCVFVHCIAMSFMTILSVTPDMLRCSPQIVQSRGGMTMSRASKIYELVKNGIAHRDNFRFII